MMMMSKRGAAMHTPDYQIKHFSKARQATLDVLRLSEHKHTIHGLVEVDVTTARAFIRDYEARTGEQVSFTGFILACLGKAVDADKLIQASRTGNNLIIFEDVDVNTMIERTTAAGEKVVRPYVVRATNRKTYWDINRELWAAQAQPEASLLPVWTQRYGNLLLSLPWPLRRLVWKLMLSNPHRWRKWGGTVALTAVGMFGEGGGWGIPIVPNTLTVTLGGIAEKPGIVDGQIKTREYLSLTLSFDHDIVDGAPAARFAARLKRLIESGYGLTDSLPTTAQGSPVVSG
jgi:pyruvate/2-oxoglutarate dehydrogenase complex dihydrolipoamide acyltransferase (E2) component